MSETLFAIELSMRIDPAGSPPTRSQDRLCAELRELARALPNGGSRAEAHAYWQHVSQLLLRELPFCTRGIWDYSNDDGEAARMFADYASTLKNKKGVRAVPSVMPGQSPMRSYAGELYCNVTFAWLVSTSSRTGRGLSISCAVAPNILWTRQTFGHLLRTMQLVDTGDLRSSVFYTIPADPSFALTVPDLAAQEFAYLRPIEG